MGGSDNPVEDLLEHFGIKGMKWGVHRSETQLSGGGGGETTVAKKANGQIKKVSGGKNASASEDALRVSSTKQIAKKSGTQALSTKELQELVNRMNLEQQYTQLRSKEPSTFAKGQGVIKKILGVAKTGQEIYGVINSPAGKAATSLGSKLIKQAMKEAE
jgi:hypothetical protein